VKSKTLLILSVALILAVVLAVSVSSYKGASQSIYPQSSMYMVSIVDSSGYPVANAGVYILDSSSSWAFMGNTNGWGQAAFSGWQGIQVQARYNGVSANGVLMDQPQTLTLSLPITVQHVATPQPTPHVQTFNFIVQSSPDQSGIIGITDAATGGMNQGSYPAGTVLTFNAVPAISGYRFHHYTVNGEFYSSDATTTYATIAGETTVIGYFMPVDDTTPTTNPTAQPTAHPTPTPTHTWTTPTPTPTAKPGFFEWLYNLFFGWLN
jgi:hypothetical protein